MLKGLQWVSLAACCLLGAVIVCVLMVQYWDKVSVVPVVRAQSALMGGSKIVEVEQDSPRFGARVVKVTVGNQVVTPGFYDPHDRRPSSAVPFQAGDDWLKEMTFTIKNRSSKTFVQIFQDVCFPDTKMTRGYLLCQSMDLGRIPENAAYTVEGNKFDQGSKQPLDFRPGQEMKISVAPYAKEIRRKIEERQPFSTISRCFINVNAGFFEDGMQWQLTSYSVPDPNRHGFFVRLHPSEFPVKDTRIAYQPNEAHD